MLKKFILVVITLSICGCKTEYKEFSSKVSAGITSEEVEVYLSENGFSYQYISCDELNALLSSLKKECINDDSLGVIKVIVNDGSYMLGMGSSDVYFQLEIGQNGKVIDVYTDTIYTFL